MLSKAAQDSDAALSCLRCYTNTGLRGTHVCGIDTYNFNSTLEGAFTSANDQVQMFAEEQHSPELYANNVRKVMGDALGAELSSHGIPQQQALKRNGIYVDWTGRCASLCIDGDISGMASLVYCCLHDWMWHGTAVNFL